MTLILSANSYSQKEINYETVDMENSDRSLPMPNGTKIFENEDGSYLVSLPEGYEYILKAVESDEILTAAGGSVTCTCTGGSGGCSPCNKGKMYGCMMTTCNSCTKGAIMNPGGGKKEYDVLGIIARDITPLRFLSINKIDETNLGSLLKSSEIPYFSNLHSAIFQYSKANEMIDEYLKNVFSPEDFARIKEGKEPNVEIVYALADFYGNTIGIIVPKSKLTGDEIIQAAASWTCKCNTAGSSCPDESTIIYNACNANNCKSCTGSKSIKHNNTGGLELAY